MVNKSIREQREFPGYEYVSKKISEEIRRFGGTDEYWYDNITRALEIIRNAYYQSLTNNAHLMMWFIVKNGKYRDELNGDIYLTRKKKTLFRYDSLYLSYTATPIPQKSKELLYLEDAWEDINFRLEIVSKALDEAINIIIDNGVCCHPEGSCNNISCENCYRETLMDMSKGENNE